MDSRTGGYRGKAVELLKTKRMFIGERARQTQDTEKAKRITIEDLPCELGSRIVQEV